MNAVYREARSTLLLAIPITIGQVSQMLMGITDAVMVGRVGTVPLAASAFGIGVFNVFFIIGVGLLTPVAVFASRARGAGRHDEAGEYLRHGLLLAFVSGTAEIVLIVFLGLHLSWFRQPPEVMAVVNPFFLLIGFSLLPTLAYLALRQFAESMGRPWVPVFFILGGVALNAALNWAFIYGHLGMPALGLTGSGISTLISRTVGSAAIFIWLRQDPAMRIAWPRRWFAPISRERLRRMMSVGLPASGCLLFESGAFAAATVMMGWLGAVALAAHQIAINCAALTFMVALGISMAVGMRTSAAVGAGEHSRLRPIWVGGAAMGAAMGLVVTGLFLAYGRWISAAFIKDPQVIAMSTSLLVVAAVFQIFDGNQVINSAALRGITDVKVPAVITFVAYWLIALPVGYILGIRWGYGPTGIWIGLAAGLAAAAVMLALRFIRRSGADARHMGAGA
jgi:multidrug resistance protein, MATE family